MFNQYLSTALARAAYERLDDDGTYYAEIPGFEGVYATGESLDACRSELAAVLEGWILLGVSLHHELPEIDGVRLLVPA